MTPAHAEQLLEHLAETDRVVMPPSPLGQLREATPPTKRGPYVKPNGLWYACGNAWLGWILSAMPARLQNYKYVYTLELRPQTMCVIRTGHQFEDFEQRYKAQHGTAINWHDVYADYTGIEICPYRGERRMAPDSDWYYSWDVASGCVWDPTAVAAITKIGVFP